MTESTADWTPRIRPRRLRSTAAMRRLVAETRLHPAELILPLFVREGASEPTAIGSMPGVQQHSLDSLRRAVAEAAEAGVGGVMLFGIPTVKDANGTGATDPDGILNLATRAVVAEAGDALVVQTDLCLDEFTDHGHCGVLAPSLPTGTAARFSESFGTGGVGPGSGTVIVDNDATLLRYRDMAIAQAESGSQLLGLSGMMDGQVAAVRDALDGAGFPDTAILGYAAKYASAFYGPFREAVDSSLVGDRRTYQLDPGNRREGLREVMLDIDEGADVVMVKPAMSYLDVLADAAELSPVPVWAYQVSGEYAMIEAAAANGWIDRRRAIEESVVGIRRAGADAVLTYWATELAGWLR
jgi:porphobilinogen synthase